MRSSPATTLLAPASGADGVSRGSLATPHTGQSLSHFPCLPSFNEWTAIALSYSVFVTLNKFKHFHDTLRAIALDNANGNPTLFGAHTTGRFVIFLDATRGGSRVSDPVTYRKFDRCDVYLNKNPRFKIDTVDTTVPQNRDCYPARCGLRSSYLALTSTRISQTHSKLQLLITLRGSNTLQSAELHTMSRTLSIHDSPERYS